MLDIFNTLDTERHQRTIAFVVNFQQMPNLVVSLNFADFAQLNDSSQKHLKENLVYQT